MRRFLRLAADGSEEVRWNKVGLAKEVLAELPTQVCLCILCQLFNILIHYGFPISNLENHFSIEES